MLPDLDAHRLAQHVRRARIGAHALLPLRGFPLRPQHPLGQLPRLHAAECRRRHAAME